MFVYTTGQEEMILQNQREIIELDYRKMQEKSAEQIMTIMIKGGEMMTETETQIIYTTSQAETNVIPTGLSLIIQKILYF